MRTLADAPNDFGFSFEKIAPYLSDPLVLIGFFIFLGFLIARVIVTSGLIPVLNQRQGFTILRSILLYGFLIGLAITALGFGLKYRELSAKDQKQAVTLLSQELAANIQTAGELQKNSATILNLVDVVAETVRYPKIRILEVLFPSKNTELPVNATPFAEDMARTALQQVVLEKLNNNPEEVEKLKAAGRLFVSKIDETINTVKSLGDGSGTRYVMRSEVWAAELPILHRVHMFSVDAYQRSYGVLLNLRNEYSIVIDRCIDYLKSVREFFAAAADNLTYESLSKVLLAERYSLSLIASYGKELVSCIEETKGLEEKAAKISANL